MKKLNVAIIGQGRSGRGIHGEYFLTDGAKNLFNVVAVADWIEGRRNRARETFNCDVYEDYKEFYKRDDIDLVLNASYSYEHYPITMDLLEHKMNVLVEKPFSKYVMECERMIKAAKENGVGLFVFQQSHFAPYYERVKEIIASGKLGKIYEIDLNFSGFARRWDWQCSNRFYGGNLLNTCPHPMEMALDLLDTDDMPTVNSWLKITNSAGDAEDYVKVLLTYPDRPLIQVDSKSIDAYSDYTVKICAEKGSLKATIGEINWKYHNDKPLPPLQLTALCGEDGVSPAYCTETLEWNEFKEELKGNAFDVGTRKFYENIYDHMVNGAELVIKPEKIAQQIRVMELIHAQNPFPTIY